MGLCPHLFIIGDRCLFHRAFWLYSIPCDASSDESDLCQTRARSNQLFSSICHRFGQSSRYGNIAGVATSISVGGPGAVFWMWVSAFLGASTAYAEGTLAQLHKKKDPFYGGYHGGPAYYIHDYVEKKRKKKYKSLKKHI